LGPERRNREGLRNRLGRTFETALSRPALAELDLWRLFSTMIKISYAGFQGIGDADLARSRCSGVMPEAPGVCYALYLAT
jgi:hypothetical protein